MIAFLICAPSDWFDERGADIEMIDQTATLQKSREEEVNSSTAVISQFKKAKFRKLNYDLKDAYGKVTFTANFYHEGSFLFARDYMFTSDVPYKGMKRDIDPLGLIEQGKTLFETKESGIKLKRSISYFDRSDIDSLYEVLLEMPFDTLMFSESEYDQVVKSYKRMRSAH